MIVDDAFFMRNLLRCILEMDGYTVVADAGDGEEAMAKYRVCRPDLVLMDVLMPGKNGIDATREIISFDPDACVVICSMAGREGLVRFAREAGARGVILKPFSTEQVLETVGKALKEKARPLPVRPTVRAGTIQCE
jgi:two-component system, chemotaxis family, chemotaxis protein CheY